MEAGEVIGTYRIVRKLGAGGMGDVFLAEHTGTGDEVALKLPRLGENPDGDDVRRFRRESRAAASLAHRNVCRVIDIGEADGRHFLVMNYVPGQSLDKTGRLDPRRAAVLVRKLALGMRAVHEKGIVHRDLKPQNVIIDETGEPIIVDFGLARSIDRESSKLTRTGHYLGTPVYSSPEQIENAGTAGPATDVYSLGVILFELLTGRLPFTAGSLPALFHEILTAEPPVPSSLREGVPPDLDAITLRALEKEPGDRFASMDEFTRELTAYLKGRPVRSTVRAASPAPRRFPIWFDWRRIDRHWIVGGGVFAVLCVVVLPFALNWETEHDEPVVTPDPVRKSDPTPDPEPVPAQALAEWSVDRFARAIRDGAERPAEPALDDWVENREPPGDDVSVLRRELAGRTLEAFPNDEAGARGLARLFAALSRVSEKERLALRQGDAGQFGGAQFGGGGIGGGGLGRPPESLVVDALGTNGTPTARGVLTTIAYGRPVEETAPHEAFDPLLRETAALELLDHWQADRSREELRLAFRYRTGDVRAELAQPLPHPTAGNEDETEVAFLVSLLDELAVPNAAAPRDEEGYGPGPRRSLGMRAPIGEGVVFSGAGGAASQGGFDAEKCVTAILSRLVKSQTPDARTVLEQITSGERKVDVAIGVLPSYAETMGLELRMARRDENWSPRPIPSGVPALALQHLLKWDDEESRAFVAGWLLDEAERDLPRDATGVADAVPHGALELVRREASADMRRELVRDLRPRSAIARAVALAVVSGLEVENLAAQRDLCLADDTSADQRSAFERQHLESLQRAHAALFRWSPAEWTPIDPYGDLSDIEGGFRYGDLSDIEGGFRGGSLDSLEVPESSEVRPLPPAEALVVFDVFSDPAWIRGLATRVRTGGPDKALQFDLLCAIPTAAARTAVHDELQRLESRGPAPLLPPMRPLQLYAPSGNRFGNDWLDPATLPALKRLDRAKLLMRAVVHDPKGGVRNVPTSPDDRERLRLWFTATAQFVEVLDQRLRQRIDGTPPSPDADERTRLLGFALPEEATILGEVRLVWPDDLAKLGRVPSALQPTVVHYVRFELPAGRSSANREIGRLLPEGTLGGDESWIDWFHEDDTTTRSIDVLLEPVPNRTACSLIVVEVEK